MTPTTETGAFFPTGDRNENPADIGLWPLLVEDFRTHGSHLGAAGFWAVALHRLGNARMAVRPKLARAPLTAAYRAAFHGVIALWGIDLPYNIKLGRRVRIEHHGCLMIGAREIGDDVVIRHSVTLGLQRRGGRELPTIGNRVEIGPGACIVGRARIGDDAYVGPNTVIANDVKPGAVILGVPPRAFTHEAFAERMTKRALEHPVVKTMAYVLATLCP